MGRSEKARQRPTCVVIDVGGEAQLGAAAHDPGQRFDRLCREDAPLMVTPFWPWIGIEDEHTGEERVRGGLDNGLGVAAPYPHVGEMLALERCKSRDDAVKKRLAADDCNIRIGLRLFNEMLACAESDLEPHFVWRRGERTPRGQRLRRY